MRSFSPQIERNGSPLKHPPRSCKALIGRLDEWLTAVSASAAGWKFEEIQYVRAAADCLAVDDMRRGLPAATSVDGATALLSSEIALSGDFFPHLPGKDGFLRERDGPWVRMRGSSGFTRAYRVLAAYRDQRTGDEIWSAIEDESADYATFAVCSFVHIVHDDGNGPTRIRDRRWLGRCE